MRNFLELCKRRYSVRKYLSRKVPRKIILKCIEAARLAPSAENIQPWRYLVIDQEPLLSQLKEAAFNGIYTPTRWANSAPVIIVILAEINFLVHRIAPLFQKINYHLIDIGIATEHLILQATELGLGTCWIGWFNVKKVQQLFEIPKKYKIIGLLTLGYYEKEKTVAVKKHRKLIDEIVWFNQINKK